MIQKAEIMNFEYIRELGNELSSNVKLYINKQTNQYVAIKFFSKQQKKSENEAFLREVEIQYSVQCVLGDRVGHILSIGSISQQIDNSQQNSRKSVKQNCTNFLVMKSYQNGSLNNLINQFGSFQIETVRYIFRQLVISNIQQSNFLTAILKLHNQGVIHRDISLNNIIISDDYRLVLIDFGLSCYYPKSQNRLPRLTDFAGTHPFVAPEVVEGSPYLGHQADIFSLGVVLYILIHGIVPFKVASEDDEEFQKFQSTFIGETPLNVLLLKMLCKFPSKRPKIEDVMEDLWIKQSKNDDEERIGIQELQQKCHKS